MHMNPGSEAPRPAPQPALDPRTARCGFARVFGPGVDFYIRSYSVTIGRPSKSQTADITVDLPNISRQHATIAYNFTTGRWELSVLGKNGVIVNEEQVGAGATVALASRDLLHLGDYEHYVFFLLPAGAPAVGPQAAVGGPADPPAAPAPSHEATSQAVPA